MTSNAAPVKMCLNANCRRKGGGLQQGDRGFSPFDYEGNTDRSQWTGKPLERYNWKLGIIYSWDLFLNH